MNRIALALVLAITPLAGFAQQSISEADHNERIAAVMNGRDQMVSGLANEIAGLKVMNAQLARQLADEKKKVEACLPPPKSESKK